MEEPGSESKNDIQLEKQAAWDKVAEQVDKITDKLGKPIDPEIKEAVTAFIVNKFPTYDSCEGHIEKHSDKIIILRPRVSVGYDEPHQRFVNESEIRNRIASQFGISPDKLEENESAQRAYWDCIQKHDVIETPEYLEIRAKNRELEKLISDIIQAFYKDREAQESIRLSIERIGPAGHFSVITGKELSEEIEESDLKKFQEELQQAQEEMRTFTQFLKERFFNSTM